MLVRNSLWIVGAVALVGLGVVAVTQQVRLRSLEAAEGGADRRAREAAGEVARRRMADSTGVARRSEAVRAALADRVHFGFDLSMIRPTDAEILDEKISILQADPHARIRIIGHCDERGGEIYNLALGRRRALAARAYLVQHGVAASRIETVSAGEGEPLDLRHNAEAWATNRRDEFKVIDGDDLVGRRPPESH